MILETIKPFTTWLHIHHHWAGFFTFLIAFAESFAVIGSIIPGSVTLTAIGVMIGSGVLPTSETFMWAIAGAVLGDAVSFWLGYHFHGKLRSMWPFSRWPDLITKGEAFFNRHGGKSIFLGRFVGPIRSILPVVAGMMNMPIKRFIVVDVISAFAWAPCYLLPGMLVGAASLELDPETATRFIMLLLSGILLVVILTWFTKHSLTFCIKKIDLFFNKVWHYFQKHPTLHPITTALRNPKLPDGHGQLTLALFFLITFLLLVWLSLYVFLCGDANIELNQKLNYLFRSIRLDMLDRFFVGVTLLGEIFVVTAVIAAVFFWFCIQKQWRTAAYWLANGFFVNALCYVLKIGVQAVRPTGLMVVPSTFSFPSGHAALSVGIFGLLAVFVAETLKPEKRWISYCSFGSLIFLILLSRLYLGVHWFTDILGGLLLGTMAVMLTTLLYRRKAHPKLKLSGLLFSSLLALVIAWGFMFKYEFNNELHATTLYFKQKSITFNSWWEQKQPILPRYLLNLIGKTNSTFNLQWAAPLTQIEAQLLKNGWQKAPEFSVFDVIDKVAAKHKMHQLPLLPLLYEHQTPVLTMTKALTPDTPLLILRLWQSHDQFSDSSLPLWIGSVHYRILWPHLWVPFHKKWLPLLPPPTQMLQPTLEGLPWRAQSYALPPLKLEQEQETTQRVLLIHSK